MRVAWVCENYPPNRGGMAQSCDRIVDGLRRRGARIDVVHLTRTDVGWSRAAQQHGLLLTCPLGDDPADALQRVSTAIAAEHRADPYSHVVAFGGSYPVLAGPVLGAWLGVPLVTLLRGNDFDLAVFSARRRPALLDALRASARVCVVSRANVERVAALVPGARVTWITNGIDTATWEALPSDLDTAAAWRTAHVADDRRLVALIGHLKRKKGALFLLDALASSGVADRLHLLTVGELDDDLAERLDRLEARGDPPHTHLPFLDRYELLGLLPAVDVVALPSFYDGLPNVALEAAALGVPLLASDAGGLADLVDDQVGFPFPAGDLSGCRAALVSAATAPLAELARRGEQARARVVAAFSADRELDAYLAVLGDTTPTAP